MFVLRVHECTLIIQYPVLEPFSAGTPRVPAQVSQNQYQYPDQRGRNFHTFKHPLNFYLMLFVVECFNKWLDNERNTGRIWMTTVNVLKYTRVQRNIYSNPDFTFETNAAVFSCLFQDRWWIPTNFSISKTAGSLQCIHYSDIFSPPSLLVNKILRTWDLAQKDRQHACTDEGESVRSSPRSVNLLE